MKKILSFVLSLSLMIFMFFSVNVNSYAVDECPFDVSRSDGQPVNWFGFEGEVESECVLDCKYVSSTLSICHSGIIIKNKDASAADNRIETTKQWISSVTLNEVNVSYSGTMYAMKLDGRDNYTVNLVGHNKVVITGSQSYAVNILSRIKNLQFSGSGCLELHGQNAAVYCPNGSKLIAGKVLGSSDANATEEDCEPIDLSNVNWNALKTVFIYGMPESTPSSGSHEHHFEWQTITEPTMYADGLAGDVCTICGYAKNTQPLSAYGFAINDYATKLVEASKSGQIIKIELGEWNSFPKAFMEKIAAKSAQNVTFVLKYKWNHVKQEITIPAGTAVDTSLDWYGPAKMAELYGAN